MTELDKIKLYLNIPLEDSEQDLLLEMLLEESYHEIAATTNRTVEFIKDNPVGKSAAVKVVVVKHNRRGTEGMKSQSFAGSSESYIDGIEAEIKTQLKSLRGARFV